MVGDVGVVEVDPEPQLFGEVFPLLGVAEDTVETAAHEGLDPVLENRVPARDPEFLLDLDLDGETVGVPSALSRHVVAAHGAIAGKHVLHDAGQRVAVVGQAVRRRRAFVEDEPRSTGALGQGLRKDVGVAPELANARLQAREVDDGRNFFEDRFAHGAHRLRPPGNPGNAPQIDDPGWPARSAASHSSVRKIDEMPDSGSAPPGLQWRMFGQLAARRSSALREK